MFTGLPLSASDAGTGRLVQRPICRRVVSCGVAGVDGPQVLEEGKTEGPHPT